MAAESYLEHLAHEARTNRAVAERLSGALRLISGNNVMVSGDGVALVSSENGAEPYYVHVTQGTCDCADAIYRELACKHVLAARIVRATQAGLRLLTDQEYREMVRLHLACIETTGKLTTQDVCSELTRHGMIEQAQVLTPNAHQHQHQHQSRRWMVTPEGLALLGTHPLDLLITSVA